MWKIGRMTKTPGVDLAEFEIDKYEHEAMIVVFDTIDGGIADMIVNFLNENNIE